MAAGSARAMLRLLGRMAAVGAAGGVAAAGAIWSGNRPAPPPADLPVLADDAPTRASQLAALQGSSPANPFDILVIGGGATGAGVALDAATRGIRVALVERDDFASGTSSRSTKLVHGGVRYLEKAVMQRDAAQLKLVYGALKERATLLQNAPHLTWPLPTVMPCYQLWQLPYSWAGLKLYDLIAGPSIIHPSRYVTASEAHSLIPTLAIKNPGGEELKGALVYTDGQMDDARLNVAIAVTAARAGAVVANHTEVTALVKDPVTGLVSGAILKDKLSGKQIQVHAKATVNATGVYCDKIRKMASPDVEPIICASSGSHIVLPQYYLGTNATGPVNAGLIIPKTKDGRVLFALPWMGSVLAGTTDERSDITDSPRPSAKEVEFIVQTLKDYLTVEVREADVLSEWSGLRPLVNLAPKGSEEGKEFNTSNIVRDHVIILDDQTGLVTITGGKWTTYRSMAEETVDAALQAAKSKDLTISPLRKQSVTEHIPITGGEGYYKGFSVQLAQSSVVLAPNARGKLVPTPLDMSTATHLAHSYGLRALQVLRIAAEEALGSHLAPNHPYLQAEVAYSARYEMCETATDFLLYRSRLAFLDADAAIAALPRVVEILGREHKWGSWRRRSEVAAARKALQQFKPS